VWWLTLPAGWPRIQVRFLAEWGDLSRIHNNQTGSETLRVKVRVTLRLSVYHRSVRIDVTPLEIHDQYILNEHLRLWSLCNILSEERMGLSLIAAAGCRQRSQSRVWVPRDSWYFVASDSRLPQPRGRWDWSGSCGVKVSEGDGTGQDRAEWRDLSQMGLVRIVRSEGIWGRWDSSGSCGVKGSESDGTGQDRAEWRDLSQMGLVRIVRSKGVWGGWDWSRSCGVKGSEADGTGQDRVQWRF
jgi:hypothetical protein